MENYFCLAEQFTTQSEPSYCGPASLIMCLNALAIDPNRTWKGVWRWYSEEVLHCTSPETMLKGMSLDQLSQLARCNGLHTMTFRVPDAVSPQLEFIHSHKEQIHQHSKHLHFSDDCCHEGHHQSLHHNTSALFVHQSDLELFQTAVFASSRTEGLLQMVNVSRKKLDQTGDGHFCPVGGLNSEADKVLLLDTARFKYPPQWVDMGLLYDAMKSIDNDTQKPRGFILLSKKLPKPAKKQLPLLLTRLPRLERVDLSATLGRHLLETKDAKLGSVLACLSEDRKVLSALFCYLFQLNDVYSCEAHDSASDLISQGIFTSNQSYLNLRRQLRSCAIFADVEHLVESEEGKGCRVIRMLT